VAGKKQDYNVCGICEFSACGNDFGAALLAIHDTEGRGDVITCVLRSFAGLQDGVSGCTNVVDNDDARAG
jgi:hypothetical protein